MSHFILTACIAEPGTFNTHLNYLLKKNSLPEFIADDHAPSHKIFNIASLSRTVTPSQEVLNDHMEEDDILSTINATEPEKETPATALSAPTETKPKEQRHDKKKQLSHIPAAGLRLVVYAQ